MFEWIAGDEDAAFICVAWEGAIAGAEPGREAAPGTDTDCERGERVRACARGLVVDVSESRPSAGIPCGGWGAAAVSKATVAACTALVLGEGRCAMEGACAAEGA